MRLDNLRESRNVEDRRSGRGKRGAIAVSGGTIVLVLIAAAITGKNPIHLLQRLGNQGGQAPSSSQATVDPRDPGAIFTRKILGTTEDTWRELMPTMGARYQEPTLVLFRDSVSSACGYQQAAVGPFYCPADRMAYFDLDFLDALQKKLGAQGDFAAGYVIAHEIGHHVQRLLGTSERVRRRGGRKGPTGTSVRLELQADCYAGVWGAHVKKRGLLEVGDAEEALGAASAIGDDTLQRRARGRVSPETFSHGTSEQRVRWFKQGMESGDPRTCDTFETTSL